MGGFITSHTDGGFIHQGADGFQVKGQGSLQIGLGTEQISPRRSPLRRSINSSVHAWSLQPVDWRTVQLHIIYFHTAR